MRLNLAASALLRWSALTVIAVLAARVPDAGAQIVCNSAIGADVVVKDLVVIRRWGTVNGITGYSIGSLCCNVGDQPLEWVAGTNRHPFIAMNAYRLRDSRFEQIGMSWGKHAFSAQANSDCCACINPGSGSLLGVGCSDAYSSSLNGNQAGFNNVGGLGPRTQVNPVTGEFAFPYATQGQAGDAIYKRLQIRNNTLNPANNAGALYFAELHFIAPDDAEAGNDLNNASYMPIEVGSLVDGGYELSYAGAPRPTKPAIFAWQEFDSNVTIETIDVPGDGRFYLAYKITELGNSQWQYEYALCNYNSHRAGRLFRIAVPDGVQVSNIGFHDVDYHSGEGVDGEEWSSAVSGGAITWSTSTFDENANANALRWGTTYNFRFRANTPPALSVGSIGLFRDGSPGVINVAAAAPGPELGGGAGPANDRCADALDVQLGQTAFSIENADLDGPPFECAASIPSRDVWFRFTSSFDGKVRVSTCGSAGFDSLIAVYNACACDGETLASPIRCSDNNCGSDAKVVFKAKAGRCYLIRVAGGAGGTPLGTLQIAAIDDELASYADIILTGDNAGDRFGQSVGSAGDMKNDGLNDVIVGAYLNDSQAGNAGRCEVYMGTSFALSSGVSGEFAGDQFGKIVAGGRDFNGDGFADILVGAPLNDEHGVSSGKVYCFSGFNESLLWSVRGQLPGDRMGSAIACIDDVNFDGVADVVVGAPFNDIGGPNAGRAYVLAGQDGSVIHILQGKRAGEQFGAALASIGDVNGDGAGDFAVGAPRSNMSGQNAGRIGIYSGANGAQLQVIKGAAGERFGSALSGITASVGGKTRTYIAIGAPRSNANGVNSGRVYVYSRNHESPDCNLMLCAGAVIDGEQAGDQFGTAVAVGNVRGSDLPDIIAGAPGSDANGDRSGSAAIVHAGNGSIIARIVGEAAGDAFGTSVAVVDDLDSDGLLDVAIGAPRNDAAAPDAGRAYVFFSQSTSLFRFVGGSVDDDQHEYFARSGMVADRDGDGDFDADDLLVILTHWGPCLSADCPGDVNADGRVDGLDVTLALAAAQ